ncbi:MAG: hypothetical protein M3P51_06605 [Chloroflexota bacterium]|nr:hypothetical protein [Chloroflexota bacterium]
MSLQPRPVPTVPDDTARIARAVFPKGNVLIAHPHEHVAIYEDTPGHSPVHTYW